jgi:hypothetical protein
MAIGGRMRHRRRANPSWGVRHVEVGFAGACGRRGAAAGEPRAKQVRFARPRPDEEAPPEAGGLARRGSFDLCVRFVIAKGRRSTGAG